MVQIFADAGRQGGGGKRNKGLVPVAVSVRSVKDRPAIHRPSAYSVHIDCKGMTGRGYNRQKASLVGGACGTMCDQVGEGLFQKLGQVGQSLYKSIKAQVMRMAPANKSDMKSYCSAIADVLFDIGLGLKDMSPKTRARVADIFKRAVMAMLKGKPPNIKSMVRRIYGAIAKN